MASLGYLEASKVSTPQDMLAALHGAIRGILVALSFRCAVIWALALPLLFSSEKASMGQFRVLSKQYISGFVQQFNNPDQNIDTRQVRIKARFDYTDLEFIWTLPMRSKWSE
jgi:hypothetical protein